MAGNLFGPKRENGGDPSGRNRRGKTDGGDAAKELSAPARHLQKLIVEKDASALAEQYANYLVAFPKLTLEPGPQYELARLLEQGGKAGLALLAYERLIKSAPEAPVTVNALFAAGRICATMSARYEDAERYLSQFLETKPLLREYQEASRILEHVRQHLAAEALPEPSPLQPSRTDVASEQRKIESDDKEKPTAPTQEKTASSKWRISTGEFEAFLQKDVGVTEPAEMDEIATERRADQTEIFTASERAKLRAERIFSGASETKTVGADAPAEGPAPAPAVEPLPKREIKRKTQNLQDSRYIITVAMGKRVKFPIVVDVVSEHLQIDRASAERRIILGKGILFRDLDLPSAAQLLRIFQKAGQDILVVRVTPTIVFRKEMEALNCTFKDRSIRFTTLGEAIEVSCEEIMLLCCGSVRLSAGGGSPKSVLDIFARSPQVLLRIWENTFDFRASNLNLPSFEEKNFLILCKRFAAVSPLALRTGVFDKMIERELLAPQIFESLVEYDNYNYWHLLNVYGETIEPDELLSAL